MASSRVARQRLAQIASRLSGPAGRKSSKYLAFAISEVSLTNLNLPCDGVASARATALLDLEWREAGPFPHPYRAHREICRPDPSAISSVLQMREEMSGMS